MPQMEAALNAFISTIYVAPKYDLFTQTEIIVNNIKNNKIVFNYSLLIRFVEKYNAAKNLLVRRLDGIAMVNRFLTTHIVI